MAGKKTECFLFFSLSVAVGKKDELKDTENNLRVYVKSESKKVTEHFNRLCQVFVVEFSVLLIRLPRGSYL